MLYGCWQLFYSLHAPIRKRRKTPMNFNDLSVNTPENTAISSLKTEPFRTNASDGVSVRADLNPLIMWGRFVLENGINGVKTINGVKLLRTVASIQVQSGTPMEITD